MMKYMKLRVLPICAMTLLLSSCGGKILATIGGSVTGLSGNTQLVLQDNGGDNLTVKGNGTFSFGTQLEAGSTYNVTILTQPVISSGASLGQPAGETCVVNNAVGVVQQSIGDVNSVAVYCAVTPSSNNVVQGVIHNLVAGKSVVLTNNGTETITVNGTASANVNFAFTTPMAIGATYNVAVAGPSGTSCSILNNSGTGTIPGTGTTPVVVQC